MKNKGALLLTAVAFVAVIMGAAVLYSQLGERTPVGDLVVEDPAPTQSMTEALQESEPQHTESVVVLAPDFTVQDADGNEVTLRDFVGKPVVLNFWASWCGPCKSEMPDFDAAYARQGEEIHFLMVNMTDGARETIDSAKDFIADSGYSFPVYFDTQYSAAIAYNVMSLPTTYFINTDGVAVARASGAIDAETLEMGISMILPTE